MKQIARQNGKFMNIKSIEGTQVWKEIKQEQEEINGEGFAILLKTSWLTRKTIQGDEHFYKVKI